MKFLLRPWKKSDLNSLVIHANNPKIGGNLTDAFPYPYTYEDGKVFIEKFTTSKPTNVMCIEVNGEACGAVGIHPQKDVYRLNAELGYWLSEEHWGKGIMTNAIKQMVNYAFKTFEIKRLFAQPYGTNIGSQRVLEKAGFTLEAKFEKMVIKNGEIKDLWVYAVRRENWKKG